MEIENSQQCKISVIIPVYNVEEYLSECLDSVINQTLKDIEIICINDGSTDKSVEILDRYAKKDPPPPIYMINKENQGAGMARNDGIKFASGEFVTFMDSDDFYPDNNTLEILYKKAKENNVLICGGEFCEYKNNGSIRTVFIDLFWGYCFEKEGITDYKDYQFDYGYHRFIYNRDFLIKNNLFFEDYKRFQDPPFFVKTMISAGKFYALKKITYVYRASYKKIKWTTRKTVDMLRGMRDNLKISKKYNLDKLHILTCARLFDKYRTDIFLGRIKKADVKAISEYLETKKEIDKNIIKNTGIEKNLFVLLIKDLLQNIFCLKNSIDKKHKVINVLGIKFKIRRNIKNAGVKVHAEN